MEGYDVLKLIFLFIIFIEAFVMGVMPVKVKKCKNNPSVLGVANAFSGGVFISISLMHIMPEQTGSYQEFMCNRFNERNPGDDCPEFFPLPYLLLVCGYVVILVLDKVLFDSHPMIHDHNGHAAGDDHDSIVKKSVTRASLTLNEKVGEIADQTNSPEIREKLRA